jgi:4-hydroxy 2-oxovalerate aldolase
VSALAVPVDALAEELLRYGVPAHEILAEVGRRRYVGGQEDMLIDVAIELAAAKEVAA